MNRDAPTIGVLALQGDVREHLRILTSLGAVARPVRRPEELSGIQGIVIPGGESTTMCRLLDTFELREPLCEQLRSGLAAYGSCAGMITLASTILDGRDDQQPLGALDITVRRNAFGRQVDSFETDVQVEGFADAGLDTRPFRAVFIRAPWVEAIGPDVQVLASVAGDDSATQATTTQLTTRQPTTTRATITQATAPEATVTPGAGGQERAVAVRQGAVLATSFHPEMTADDRFHRLFLSMVQRG